MENFDFARQTEEFYAPLGKACKMTLATSADGRVSARTMSVVRLNGKFYIQTDRTMRKAAQLRGNPRAALCADNVQIEGTCRALGHPTAHAEFCAAFAEHFASSYKRYTALESEELYELTPDFAQKWIYEDGEPFVVRLNYAARRVEKRRYDGLFSPDGYEA